MSIFDKMKQIELICYCLFKWGDKEKNPNQNRKKESLKNLRNLKNKTKKIENKAASQDSLRTFQLETSSLKNSRKSLNRKWIGSMV
jgi:hypothetical protein